MTFYTGVAAGWLITILLPTPLQAAITNRKTPQ